MPQPVQPSPARFPVGWSKGTAALAPCGWRSVSMGHARSSVGPSSCVLRSHRLSHCELGPHQMAVGALGSPPTSYLMHNPQAKPAWCAIRLQLGLKGLVRVPRIMHGDQQVTLTTLGAYLDQIVGG